MTTMTDIAGDILGPDAISLAQAAKMLRGRGGRAPAIETLRRWANLKRGCYPLGKEGPQLILHTVKINGELLTRREWVEAFEKERLRLGERQQGTPGRPPTKRAAGHRRAEKRLDEAGVK